MAMGRITGDIEKRFFFIVSQLYSNKNLKINKIYDHTEKKEKTFFKTKYLLVFPL